MSWFRVRGLGRLKVGIALAEKESDSEIKKSKTVIKVPQQGCLFPEVSGEQNKTPKIM